MHTHTHSHTYIQMHTYTHTLYHTHTHTHTLTLSHTHTLTISHSHIHTLTQTLAVQNVRHSNTLANSLVDHHRETPLSRHTRLRPSASTSTTADKAPAPPNNYKYAAPPFVSSKFSRL